MKGQTNTSKNGEYLILGRNLDFWENFGILELEMLHPNITIISPIFHSHLKLGTT